MFKKILLAIAWNYNERQLKKIKPIVKKINEYYENRHSLSDEQIKAKTEEFKKRLEKWETLDDILPEAFATVKQACKRMVWQVFEVKWHKIKWDMIPYDVQLIGWIILHQGKIAEMKTWEGKTLVATLPVYLNALEWKWVHVVTVNDYLAERDAMWMWNLYWWLWLTTWYVTKNVPIEKRREQYAKDITYVENSELWFDYLRDNLVKSMDDRILTWRPLNYAIVDEVDSILIDEARTPLIISQPDQEPTDKYVYYNKIVKLLKPCPPETKKKKSFLFSMPDEEEEDCGDYKIDEKSKNALLTSSWIKKLEEILWVENLYKDLGFEEIHHIENALRANACYKKDVDYIVRNWEILIVDENTGRTMPWRRYSQWLHQAIEAKEWVTVQNESKTMATITYQNFFKQYKKLAWMTWTAATEWEEFEKIYDLEVIVIPTHKEVIRVDKDDLVFFSQDVKFKKALETIKFYHKMGVPILAWTSSVETSERLSKLLRKELIQHYVLNAKYHEQEANIIANAGKFGSVVVATNMAGRWTDIKLEHWLNEKIAENYAKYAQNLIKKWQWLSYVVYSRKEFDLLADWIKKVFGLQDDDIASAWKTEFKNDEMVLKIKFNKSKKTKDQPYASFYIRPANVQEPQIKQVDAHFGLFVLGTEKHESRRIDNQLRWRSWRQWDSGVTQFYVALDDDIMIKTWWLVTKVMAEKMLPKEELENMNLSNSMLTSSITRAQKQLEWQHFSIRKHLFEYDSVLNKQRENIYWIRDKILQGEDMHQFVLKYIEKVFSRLVKVYQNDLDELSKQIYEITAVKIEPSLLAENSKNLENFVIQTLTENLENKIKHIDKDKFEEMERNIILSSIDKYWVNHIDDLTYLRDKVAMYGYAQVDPLIQYKKEAFEKYQKLLSLIETEVLSVIFKTDFSFLQDNQQQIEISVWQTSPVNLDKKLKNAVNKAETTIKQEQQNLKQQEKWPKVIEKSDDFEIIELPDQDREDEKTDVEDLIEKMVKA